MSGNPFKSSAELTAFKTVYETLKNRQLTSVWIFESGDFVILAQPDNKHAEDSLPPNNLRYYDLDIEGSNVKLVTALASKCYQRLLQHILLSAHYRVIIHTFQNGSFSPSMQGSPCDLSELKEIMFTTDEDDGGYSEKMLSIGPICSVVLEGDAKSPRFGVCFWQEAAKSIKVADFFDNTAHDKLESLLVQFSPMEAIVPDLPKYHMVKKVLTRNKILVTPLQGNKKAGKSKTETVFPNNHIDDHVAAAKAFTHLNQHTAVDLVTEQKDFEIINIESFVHLNGQAVSGLNIFETGNQSMSLFKVLNKTRTAGGERLLRVWLRQPLTDRLKIEERLSVVKALVDDSSSRKSLHDNLLRRIPDFQSLSVKLEAKKNSLQDLYKCYLGAKDVKRLAEALDNMAAPLIHETFVQPLNNKLSNLEKFIDLVETTIDMDAIAEDNAFVVKSEFDDELMRLGGKKAEIKADIESALAVVAKYVGLDLKSVKLEFTNQHGYTYRVTMKDEKVLRKKQSELIIVDTHKTGVRFRDRKLDQLNRAFLAVNGEFEEQQKYVLSEISEITCGYAPIFAETGHLVSQLDCLVGFSVAAVIAPIPYSKPRISQEPGIQLSEARHPCLELLDNINFIPNSIDFSQGKCFCIITGPNLGGKSTFLRTVALNVLMAQVGSFVACEEATIFPVDRVLVRIGAGDYQLQGISTFMAEMLEASHIVRSSSERSLILIDELGRGTSTYDGLGLAWAISEHIAANIKAPTLFATHFHEVTRLADKLPEAVFNCYVDAVTSDDQFTLLYKVREGSSAKSFGLEVARLAGFPSEVLLDAKDFLEKAEMPILRNSKLLSADDVASFVSNYTQTSEKKRKQELVEEMKSKLFKAM